MPLKRKPSTIQTLPDYLKVGLHIVFVGFNPGTRSARIGHYYAGRGNQFWRLLFDSGLTKQLLTPEEDHKVFEYGIGLTDIVKRSTPSSSDLTSDDYITGVPTLESKLSKYKAGIVCFNGKTAYEKFSDRECYLGLQKETISGCPVFVAPSTSAANTVRYAEKLRYFKELSDLIKHQ